MYIDRKFPNTRLRRLRRNPNLINLVAETSLTSNDLIQPVFIKENFDGKEIIDSMPNIFRYGIDNALEEIEDIKKSGINSIAVFPVMDPANKDSQGSQAVKDNNFISTSIEAIKKQFPDIVLIADVALDPYTDHGHDGIIIDGEVDNDETIKLLIEQSLILADQALI
jgi:porphobilinogen synthase